MNLRCTATGNPEDCRVPWVEGHKVNVDAADVEPTASCVSRIPGMGGHRLRASNAEVTLGLGRRHHVRDLCRLVSRLAGHTFRFR